MRGRTVLVTNKAPVRAPLIESTAELEFITMTATGYDCVDVAAARNRGIPVSNVPEYSTHSVAQFVFALLLELYEHVAAHAEAVKAGEWTSQPDFALRKTPLYELAGKTMGIVGLGRIGRQVAVIAEAFGMTVLASKSSCASSSSASSIVRCDLDELFARRRDQLALSADGRYRRFGQSPRLGRVKPTTFLINTARGALVVELELAEALNDGRLAGAALDVVSQEPIRADNPLLRARNCLITPHIAWATAEARARLMEATVANVAAFLSGQPINVVNVAQG